MSKTPKKVTKAPVRAKRKPIPPQKTLPPKRPPKRKRGRPSIFTAALGEEVCKRLVEQKALSRVCEAADMPAFKTVYEWDAKGRAEKEVKGSLFAAFSTAFARAKELQAHAIMDEMLDIADDGRNDWVEKQTKDGDTYITLNAEHIQRSRLRVETRMKLAERLAPALYAPLQKVGDPEGKALPAATTTPLLIELVAKHGG